MFLNEISSKFLLAYEAWHNYCEENNIDDPWMLLNNFREKTHKHWKDKNDVWHIEIHSENDLSDEQKKEYDKLIKYRNQYMCEREIWEGKYILENFGYDVLSKFAQTHSQSKTALPSDKAFFDWMAQVHPCEGADGQCTFACPIFYSCALKDYGVYQNEVKVIK